MKKESALFAAIVGLSLLGCANMIAQDLASPSTKQDAAGSLAKSDTPQVLSDQDIQLFRKDVKSLKKQIVAANMDLNDAQAEKFWPIYDQYAADTATINDTKAALIQEYAQNFDTMTGDRQRTT